MLRLNLHAPDSRGERGGAPIVSHVQVVPGMTSLQGACRQSPALKAMRQVALFEEATMRFPTSLIAMTLATWGTSARAQTIIHSRPLFPALKLSFQLPGDSSALGSLPSFVVGRLSGAACPMPLVRGDGSHDTLMGVRIGPKAGPPAVPIWAQCYNPFFK